MLNRRKFLKAGTAAIPAAYIASKAKAAITEPIPVVAPPPVAAEPDFILPDVHYYATGSDSLDHFLDGGFRTGTLTILRGYCGVGKSMFLSDLHRRHGVSIITPSLSGNTNHLAHIAQRIAHDSKLVLIDDLIPIRDVDDTYHHMRSFAQKHMAAVVATVGIRALPFLPEQQHFVPVRMREQRCVDAVFRLNDGWTLDIVKNRWGGTCKGVPWRDELNRSRLDKLALRG